jgi:hypothetical protein
VRQDGADAGAAATIVEVIPVSTLM